MEWELRKEAPTPLGIRCAKMMVTLEPSRQYNWVYLGRLQFGMEDYAAALEAFEKSGDNPWHTDVMHMHIICLHKLGRTDEAEEETERLRILAARDKSARAALNLLLQALEP